jgi:hypothetical protein
MIALFKTTEGFIVWKLLSLRLCGTFQLSPLSLSAWNINQNSRNILHEFQGTSSKMLKFSEMFNILIPDFPEDDPL